MQNVSLLYYLRKGYTMSDMVNFCGVPTRKIHLSFLENNIMYEKEQLSRSCNRMKIIIYSVVFGLC